MTDEIKPTEPGPDVTPGLVPDPQPAPVAPAPVTPPVTEPVEPVTPESTHDDAKPAPEDAKPKKEPLDRRMIGLGVATGAVLIALVLLALMAFAPRLSPIKPGPVAEAARASEQRDVERVAARFASSLYTFNYRTIDDDLDRISKDATGNFSRELATVIGEVDVFKKAIVDARGESVGQVQGVDVRDVAGDTAHARVFVLQAIRNKKNPEPRQQVSMVELTLVDTSGGWKVDDVQQLAAGASGAGTATPEPD